MRPGYTLLLLAFGAWLGGCKGIVSERPLGEEVAVLNPEKLNGLWLGPGGMMGVRVHDAQKGQVIIWEAAHFETKRTPRPAVQCEPPAVAEGKCDAGLGKCVWRRQRDGQSYFYFPEVENEGHYITHGMGRSDGEWAALVYSRSGNANERLSELVQQGLLPGRIEPSGRVILGALNHDHYSLILSEKTGLFDWRGPVPFLKLPPELDPCRKGEQAK